MITLPSITKDGKPYISYSQYTSWKSEKSFNLGVAGRLEYMKSYFFGANFPDKGWGQFGKEVEGYICNREFADNFSKAEKKVLDEIETLGVFQQEIEIDFGEFVVYGFIDDMLADMSHIRDYKTASYSSKKRYEKEDYKQLDLYALWVQQEKGIIPKAEVVIVERKGNCMFGGGREVLKVGGKIWRIEREITEKGLEELRADIVKVANEIARYYKIYQLLKN